MYLIDTNVISEARKGRRADAGVRAFWRSVDEQPVFIAVQTLGELRCGVERIRLRGDALQAKRLASWLADFTTEFGDHILAFDADCAEVCGGLMARTPQHPIDKQIAAIALLHDLIVVTRNVADFRGTGATTLNPFGG